MRKVLFLGISALGHTNPTLPVMRELARRGERVIACNTGPLRQTIDRTGAVFRPYPASPLDTLNEASARGGIPAAIATILRSTEALLHFTLAEVRRERPDVIVFDSMALWGKMASTLCAAPGVAAHTLFVIDPAVLRPFSREALQVTRQFLPHLASTTAFQLRLKRRYGAAFPARAYLFPVLGDLNVSFTSRDLQPPAPLVDASFRFVGPSIEPATRADPFPFERLGDRQLVFISLGTINHRNPAFYRACFEAFADHPAQFVLSAGTPGNIDALGVIPANFVVLPFVPQLEVLQRAHAFISIGGMNSVHESLYYGVPLVVVPQHFEQVLNAAAVVRCGAGLMVREGDWRRSSAALRGALDAVLGDPGYRDAAGRFQQTLRAAGGPAAAADAVLSCIPARTADPPSVHVS